ncbi:MAG: GAF domain-containing protein, partial [Pseudolabrys sp.]
MGRRIRKSGRQAKRRRSTAGSKVHKTTAGVADLRGHLDRCTRELDDALQQQMATSEVLSIIRQSPANAQPVFDAIVKSATRLCGAIFGVVYLCDEDRLRIVATNNFTPSATTHLNQLQQQKRPERSHLGGRAILDRKVVHVPDVLEDPEYSHELALAGGWRAVLAVPLLREGIPIGALTAAKAEAAPFSDRQIQLLKTFADQAVIAIENTRVLNELRESLQQQTATADVLKVISSSPGNLEPVFDAILASATQICQAKFGTLNLFENNAFRSVALHNPPPQFRMRLGQIIHPHPDSGLAHVARTKQISHIEDIRTQKPYRAGNQAVVELADLAGARTLLSVPMLKEDELVGSMSIYRQEVRPFSEKQIELIQNFAAQAVIAIENTRLLNELRQRTDDLTESLEQQTATAEILQTINRSPGDVAPVFDAMVESAMHFCQADHGHVYSYDGEFFHLIAAHGEPRYLDWIKQTGPRLPENSLTLERVISGAPFVHIADIAEDDTYRSGNPRARTIVDKFDIHT